jgi:hypothetical protein
VNPDDPGFTEDTDFNAMRWNQKLIEKHYRYDGILFKGAWKPTKSILIGRETECLTHEASEWFINTISEGKNTPDKLWYCKEKTIPINASDHFGVLTTFTQGGGRHRFRKTRSKQTQQKQKQKQKQKRRRTTKRKI